MKSESAPLAKELENVRGVVGLVEIPIMITRSKPHRTAEDAMVQGYVPVVTDLVSSSLKFQDLAIIIIGDSIIKC